MGTAAMRALPENQRGQSVLTVLDVYREPMTGITGSPIGAVGPEDAVRVVGGNIKRFLGIPA
ncbi:hypothetical protein ACRU13_16490 [Mycobacterium colombiense]